MHICLIDKHNRVIDPQFTLFLLIYSLSCNYELVKHQAVKRLNLLPDFDSANIIDRFSITR